MEITKDYEYSISKPHKQRSTGKMISQVAHRTWLNIPLTYADQTWRIVIYTWQDVETLEIDERGWSATINGHFVGKGYTSPKLAALAIRRVLGELGRAIETAITAAELYGKSQKFCGPAPS
jgi:hypothetical protein